LQRKYCPYCIQIYREKEPDSIDGREVRRNKIWSSLVWNLEARLKLYYSRTNE
jgi:hypothetical protein